MTKYIVFLRGINVGGKSTVKMEELRQVFQKLGFQNVRTVLNSGNVTFETNLQDENSLEQKLEKTLAKEFGFDISILVRSQKDIQNLVNLNPFKAIKTDPQTRFLVTFLKTEAETTFKTLYPEKDFQILGVFDRAVCTVLTLTEKTGTPELMKRLEKEFGKKITTRTWDTVNKTLLN